MLLSKTISVGVVRRVAGRRRVRRDCRSHRRNVAGRKKSCLFGRGANTRHEEEYSERRRRHSKAALRKLRRTRRAHLPRAHTHKHT